MKQRKEKKKKKRTKRYIQNFLGGGGDTDI